MENQVYSALFDIAEENIKQSGKSFTHSKTAFLYYCEKDTSINLTNLMNLNLTNSEFLDIAYLSILSRTATDSERQLYSKQLSLPKKEFITLVYSNLIGSEEQLNSQVCLTCCPENLVYPDLQKRSVKARFMEKLLPLYRRLPKGFKNAVRQMLGAGEE